MEPGAKEQIDGRTVRAQRTRQALLDALFSLLEDGELRPTAERIAERAGVSERSVFQHFPDREALYEAVGRRQFERVLTGNVPVDPSTTGLANASTSVHRATVRPPREAGAERIDSVPSSK